MRSNKSRKKNSSIWQKTRSKSKAIIDVNPCKEIKNLKDSSNLNK